MFTYPKRGTSSSDDSIDRTTAGTGLIQNLTTRELKKFDAGAWFKKEFRAGGVENTLSAAVLEGGSQRSSTRAKRVVQRSSTRAERAVSFRGEKIPRLKYLLGWARKRTTQNGFPLGVIIEIKNESRRYPKIAHHVIEAIQSEYMRERVIVISFDRGVLNQMKQLNSTIETGLLYRDRIPNPIHSARRLKAGAIFPRRHLVRRSLIERAHKAHLKVFT